mgnify:CR=1 FL=1
MEGETLDLNKEIINVKEFTEKMSESTTNNVVKLTLGKRTGTGFLCKIYNNNIIMQVLITCFHVLDEVYIKNNPFLYFSYYSSKGITESIINFNIQRIIYQDKKLDVSIIEIKEEDNLDIYSFLEMDNSINVNNPQILNHKVYLLHYPKRVENVRYSQGKIIKLIDNFNFKTSYWTEEGSSGSPIIDYENDLVIGIHSKGRKEKKIKNNGSGIILKYAIEEFIKKKGKEINQSYKNLYPRSNIMDMIYTIPNNKPIDMFNRIFVKRYKKNCVIIYNGNKFPLTEHFLLSNITNEDKQKGEINITLKGIDYITDMSYMFSRCNNLKTVITTGIDMSKVKNMEATFEFCINLEEIICTSSWNLENVETDKNLFYKCLKLKEIPRKIEWNPLEFIELLRKLEELILLRRKIIKK